MTFDLEKKILLYTPVFKSCSIGVGASQVSLVFIGPLLAQKNENERDQILNGLSCQNRSYPKLVRPDHFGSQNWSSRTISGLGFRI